MDWVILICNRSVENELNTKCLLFALVIANCMHSCWNWPCSIYSSLRLIINIRIELSHLCNLQSPISIGCGYINKSSGNLKTKLFEVNIVIYFLTRVLIKYKVSPQRRKCTHKLRWNWRVSINANGHAIQYLVLIFYILNKNR